MPVLGGGPSLSHPGAAQIQLDSSGNGSVDIGPNIQSLFWRIHQMSISSASGKAFGVLVSVNGLPCTSKSTGSSPWTASGEPPIDIGGHDKVTVRITSGPANDTMTVAYYYEEIQGSP